ncbi:hypothetical protein [Actinocorallia populi]|uniref:hypothetical protein n=1 Tax=Actinocorallia populi TaxID=2079200 RepID=UPI0013007158|nr:hypothetical protein [Actinocorallia populi]
MSRGVRSVYLVDLILDADVDDEVEEVKKKVLGLLCPDPDHRPPCEVPWEVRSSGSLEEDGSRVISVVLFATEAQVSEFVRSVELLDKGGVRFFREHDANGEEIDGSTVIEQYEIENALR